MTTEAEENVSKYIWFPGQPGRDPIWTCVKLTYQYHGEGRYSTTVGFALTPAMTGYFEFNIETPNPYLLGETYSFTRRKEV